MSLENKIRELMESKKAQARALNEATAAGKSDDGENMNSNMQGDSRVSPYTEVNPFNGNAVTPDGSRSKPAGEDKTNPMQGNSKKADYQELDPQDQNNNTPDGTRRKSGKDEPQAKQGNSRDATVKAAPGKGYGPDSFEKPTNPGEGQVPFKEDEQLDGEAITEEDIDEAADLESAESKADDEMAEKKAKKDKRKVDMNMEELRRDIASVFSADTNLSEEFKTQAASIFEAAVIARVNNEVEKLTEELAEQAVEEINAAKEELVEKVDSYLGYVVEQWMKDNEIAVEKGLRTEVAEDFMLGLKNLFQEHYFEVPEDKVDVLEDMAVKVDEATAKLDETIQANVQLKAELDAVLRDRIVEQAGRGLTATDAEKLSKLLEGVDFDNQTLFTEKVKVIKESYFPDGRPSSPEKMLEESVQTGDKPMDVPAHMQRYVQAISRSVKK
jgi:hypothetical protein